MAFEIAASDERHLIETAMVIRRIINENRRECEQMPWHHQLIGCFLGTRRHREIMLTFLITGKPVKLANGRSKRNALSFAEDICYAAKNGDWIMPKRLTLPMTVRHLTGSAEFITILNRYGCGQSYSKTLELETAICNSVTSSDFVLPKNKSRYNNVVNHLCFDNFDLNEETPSGS